MASFSTDPSESRYLDNVACEYSLSNDVTDRKSRLTEKWLLVPKQVKTINEIITERNCIEKMRWALAANNDIVKAEAGVARFAGTHPFRFVIPDSLQSDRIYLRKPRDALYLEAAFQYLKGLSANIPVLVDEIWCFPEVATLEERPRARMWAIGAAEVALYHRRLISASDWASFCFDSAHGGFKFTSSDQDVMLVPVALFPELPRALQMCALNPHLGLEMPRMAYYFGWAMSGIIHPALKRRYEEMVIKEYCINYVVSFMEDARKGKIWDIRKEFDALLKEEVYSLPEIPLGRDGQLRTYLGSFSKLRTLTNPWTSCRYYIEISAQIFEEHTGVYASKKLEYYGRGFFVETSRAEGKDLCPVVDLDSGEETVKLEQMK